MLHGARAYSTMPEVRIEAGSALLPVEESTGLPGYATERETVVAPAGECFTLFDSSGTALAARANVAYDVAPFQSDPK